ncbi:MAG TPA: hypothetical protein VHI11_07250, partial [Jiangellaceae bacterium]|nr:hypothetical protein [Jiangellaceae bacterium]
DPIEPPRARRHYDVDAVTHDHRERGRLVVAGGMLSLKRRVTTWILAVLGPPALIAALANTRALPSLPADQPLVLNLTVGVALLGGLWPPLPEAVVGFPLLNYRFPPPFTRWTAARGCRRIERADLRAAVPAAQRRPRRQRHRPRSCCRPWSSADQGWLVDTSSPATP